MQHTILDEPEYPAPEQLPAAAVLTVFAIVATSVIILAIILPRMPDPGTWHLDLRNVDQTAGQAGFLLALALPVSLVLTLRWFSALEKRMFLFVLLALAYFRLYAIAVIVALKFWAKPYYADLNRDTLDDMPFALAVYLFLWLLTGYLYYRNKQSR